MGVLPLLARELDAPRILELIPELGSPSWTELDLGLLREGSLILRLIRQREHEDTNMMEQKEDAGGTSNQVRWFIVSGVGEDEGLRDGRVESRRSTA